MFDPCVFTDEVADDFPEAARLAADAGATCLEIRNRLLGHSVQDLPSGAVREMKLVLADLNLGIGALASPVGKCEADSPEERERHAAWFNRMLDLAEAFECPIIRGFSLWAPNRGRDWDRDLTPWLDRISDFLLPKAEAAAARGAVLALENEADTMVGSFAEARWLLQRLGEPEGLGVVWDVGNGLALGEAPYPDGYERIEPWLVHVHIKPNPAGTANPLPGEGDVTLAEALSRLWNDDYDGCISVEHFPGPEKTLQAVRDVALTIQNVTETARRSRE